MQSRYWEFIAFALLVCGLSFILLLTGNPTVALAIQAQATPTGRIASQEEIGAAWEVWKQSAHAHTYDLGLGANTTCARCKSPLNWDPSQDVAAQEAQDCYSCKRTPGGERPELESGIPVAEGEWQHIGCEICHQPAGNSFFVDVAFLNVALGEYEPISSVNELCAKCHEGRHGFMVIEELEQAEAHHNWECSACHGPHGSSSSCTDCHDVAVGAGALEHETHTEVNCTTCHDGGNLTIWLEADPDSRHAGEYITRRFAHKLTSWPSHNITVNVICERCHHARDIETPAIVSSVTCQSCHPDGAVLFWCTYFPRDPDPFRSLEDEQ